jgi:type VI secretion system protein ImpA
VSESLATAALEREDGRSTSPQSAQALLDPATPPAGVAGGLSSSPSTLPPQEPALQPSAPAVEAGHESPAPQLDPAVAALCAPLTDADPCGPDLDLGGDSAYQNFLAQAEGVLPSSFFSAEDGKPFDRTTVDLPGQLQALTRLQERTRDLRLFTMRARLLILNRDLGGFAATVAAIAEWLDKYWDGVHPRVQGDDLEPRAIALGALELPTVTFPVQYAPLYEANRLGPISYRSWMIANGEVKPRSGEQKHSLAALTDAMASADPAVLAASRKHIAMLKASLVRIRNAFTLRASTSGLQSLPALVEKISAFIDPRATVEEQQGIGAPDGEANRDGAGLKSGPAPASLAQAKDALLAIADYYSRWEPSSPTLPLVRQAHQLIGKSFVEVMTILVPTQIEKAAFQIGGDQVFELPVSRLSKLPEVAAPKPDAATPPGPAGTPAYQVSSRSQAIALLDQVNRFFRASEPASPVPMLCERARALAERDFMGVLRDVLPKAALKNAGTEK